MRKDELNMIREMLTRLLLDVEMNPNRYEQRVNDNWVHIHAVIEFLKQKAEEK